MLVIVLNKLQVAKYLLVAAVIGWISYGKAKVISSFFLICSSTPSLY